MWDLLKYAERIAVITDKGKQYTYGDLTESGTAFAEKVEKRCLVFILCTNRWESLVGYVACIEHKFVPLMLDATIQSNLLDKLIKTYKPSYLWLPEQRKEYYGFRTVYNMEEYSLLEAYDKSPLNMNEGLALLLSTSGSTGSMKLVRQSYQNIYSNMSAIADYLELDENERPVTSLPMNYTYGLSVINTHLYVGATILFTERKIVEQPFWKFFNDYGGTSIANVPSIYEILKKLNFTKMQIPTLKTMTQAGGKLSIHTNTYFADYASETGRKFIVMYGQTEATARISYLPATMALEKLGSIGIPIPRGEIILVDEQGKVIQKSGTVGEIVYKGENVTMGYSYKPEDLQKGDERHGVLYTGDFGYCDNDGYYYIVGRKDQYTKILGKRVNLLEIEELLKSHFGKSEFVCLELNSKIGIVMKGGSEELEVLNFIHNTTGFHKKIFCVKKIDKIPINRNGKPDYIAIQELLKN